nr:hypothetical protein [Cupriavidus taiwanensis]
MRLHPGGRKKRATDALVDLQKDFQRRHAGLEFKTEIPTPFS